MRYSSLSGRQNSQHGRDARAYKRLIYPRLNLQHTLIFTLRLQKQGTCRGLQKEVADPNLHEQGCKVIDEVGDGVLSSDFWQALKSRERAYRAGNDPGNSRPWFHRKKSQTGHNRYCACNASKEKSGPSSHVTLLHHSGDTE